MGSLGGIGYLERNETRELNLARLFSDSVVSRTWEGTTMVMAEDLMRVLKGNAGTQTMRVLAAREYDDWTARAKGFAEQEHAFKASWVALTLSLRGMRLRNGCSWAGGPRKAGRNRTYLINS